MFALSPTDQPSGTSRRAALLLPLLAAGCAGSDPPPSPLAPIGYRHLTALPLNVADIAIAPNDPPVAPGDLGATLQPRPAEAVRIMGRDRLAAVGTTGSARFAVTRAMLVRGGALSCVVGCRLDIVGADGGRLGFIEAEARAAATGTEASRTDATDRLLRRAMDDLNVEFEFQLRRSLRAWLVAVPPGTVGTVPAPPAGSIAREELPRS